MIIKIEAEGLQLASLTDVGRKRSGNEDSHAVWVSDDPAEFARRGALLVVADGMGGANAGEVASRLAADTVVESFRADTGNDPAYALRIAVEAANAKVHGQAQADSSQRGMGTTCTAVAVRGDTVWIGHVGDSRAYLIRGGEIHTLTHDHSLVAELVERGHLTEADAKHDPRRNVVTRSVGALADVQVDAEEIEERLQNGDSLLVCSDGLHGQVTDSEMAMLVSENEIDEACTALIALANERGGPDNITAIIVRIPGTPPPAGARRPVAASASVRSAEARPAKEAKPAAVEQKAPKDPKEPKAAGSSPILPKLMIALVVLVALVALIATQVLKQVRKPGSEPPADSVAASETVASDDSAPAAAETAAPQEPVATNKPSALALPTAKPVTPAGAVAGGAKPAATKPLGKPVAVPVTPPVAAAPAEAVMQTEIVVLTRPFQPATFVVDGQLHSQDVGSVTLRGLTPGSHTIHVEDSRARGVTMTVNVGDVPSREVVALLPGFEKVGDLDVALKGSEAARIYIDGAQYPRMAPCIVRGLAPGVHKIRAFNPKTRKMSEVTDADVRAGGTARVELDFPQ